MAVINRPRTINEPTPGQLSEEIFPIADTTLFMEYGAGDLNGIEGNVAVYKSDTPGSKATIDLSTVGDIDDAQYCSFIDLNVIGGVINAGEGCTVENCTGVSAGGVLAGGFSSMTISLAISL